jgi:predicted nucleotidyltransferase
MREKHRRAFSLIDPANPMRVVDLLLEYPVPFEELWAHSREVSIQATRIRIASVDHLIALKRQAGRPQDFADIEQLEVIRQRNETH